MELGNQIRQMRTQRGITQEEMARHFGVTAQAVSKWERGVTAPDISLLPAISAYFGVSIDALFALSDDTRMERIQNMLWDVRYLDPTDVDNARKFLLDKAKRESNNGRPHELLADMENHLAKMHRDKAAEYALEAIERDDTLRSAFSELVHARNGVCSDWCASNHHTLIRELQEYIIRHPKCPQAYLWLLDQLIQTNRLDEAENYLNTLSRFHDSYRIAFYRGMIAQQKGQDATADGIWAQMIQDNKENWMAVFDTANLLAQRGDYEKAKQHYRSALEKMPQPRYVDGLESIAQICEIQHQYADAISALEEELHIFESEWGFSSGETADAVRREIGRLQQLAVNEVRK